MREEERSRIKRGVRVKGVRILGIMKAVVQIQAVIVNISTSLPFPHTVGEERSLRKKREKRVRERSRRREGKSLVEKIRKVIQPRAQKVNINWTPAPSPTVRKRSHHMEKNIGTGKEKRKGKKVKSLKRERRKTVI